MSTDDKRILISNYLRDVVLFDANKIISQRIIVLNTAVLVSGLNHKKFKFYL